MTGAKAKVGSMKGVLVFCPVWLCDAVCAAFFLLSTYISRACPADVVTG